MGATNDAVTPYNLPYQAKDALKSYVPKIHNTYDAEELDNEHPFRFANRTGKFDCDFTRECEICWNVPPSPIAEPTPGFHSDWTQNKRNCGTTSLIRNRVRKLTNFVRRNIGRCGHSTSA